MGDCACGVTVDQLDSSAQLSFFFLELTPVCNNDCHGCGNVFAEDRSRQPLSASRWIQIIEQLAFSHPGLRLTGGEPTLHPEFETIVRRVDDAGLSFALFSNALWQEPVRLLNFLTGVSGLECILVSLHGARAESHEAFTCLPGSFSETVTNIRRAREAGLEVVTSTVITHQNCREVFEIVALSQKLGADHAVFSRYIGKPLPGLETTEDELRMAVQSIEQLNGRNGRVRFGSPVPHCFSSNHSNGCMAGFVHLTIDPWGNVRPCPHAPVIVGNLTNGHSLESILSSPTMGNWRQGLLAQCGMCSDSTRCLAGCRTMALVRGLERDPLIRY